MYETATAKRIKFENWDSNNYLMYDENFKRII